MQGTMQGINVNPLGDAMTYTKDATGKGNVIAQPVAQNGVAMMNQKSLAPGSKPAPMVSINSNEEDEKEQGPNAATTAAYEAESFDFDAMFDGEGLTEEFKEKIKVVFEAAVNERVTAIAEQLNAQANEALTEQVQLISEALSTKLDDYLNYVVEEWMTENKLALEEGIRMDIAESFLSGLKELFESHYVSVPEGKTDVLESINANNENLEKELNEKIEENISLRKALLEHQCGIAFLEATDGLTDVQIERLSSLAEGLEYETVDQYTEKLNILKESYFRPVVSSTREASVALEETTDQKITQPNDSMGVYLSAITRQAKKSNL